MAVITTTMVSSSPKDSTLNIRLRRLDSKNSVANSKYSETSTLPPYTSTTSLSKPSDPFRSSIYDTSSIHSSTLLSESTRNFIPTSSLRIETQGKKRISLPLSSNELEIPILASSQEHASDPTVGADGTKYLFIRPNWRSGSCILTHGDDASQTPIARTTYFFGPGRNPKVWISASHSKSSSSLVKSTPDAADPALAEDDEFEIVSKKLLSRTVGFESARWGAFEWRYASKAERKAHSNPPPNNLLLLERIVQAPRPKDGKGKAKEERVLVARLVRGEDTRTRGSSSGSAGNGGLLEMCLGAAGSGLEGLKIGGGSTAEGDEVEDAAPRHDAQVVDEVTVLVTCMIMLKKEIDRMRAIQMACIAGAVGA